MIILIYFYIEMASVEIRRISSYLSSSHNEPNFFAEPVARAQRWENKG